MISEYPSALVASRMQLFLAANESTQVRDKGIKKQSKRIHQKIERYCHHRGVIFQTQQPGKEGINEKSIQEAKVDCDCSGQLLCNNKSICSLEQKLASPRARLRTVSQENAKEKKIYLFIYFAQL